MTSSNDSDKRPEKRRQLFLFSNRFFIPVTEELNLPFIKPYFLLSSSLTQEKKLIFGRKYY
jgi:hypothetical protein